MFLHAVSPRLRYIGWPGPSSHLAVLGSGQLAQVFRKDFDKSHVPKFVTYFEAPITERAYRQSSSAPLPRTDYEQSQQSFNPSAFPHHEQSSSVEPEGLSPAAEIKSPISELAQFDATLLFDPSPSTSGHSIPLSQQEGYIVSHLPN